MNIKSLPIIGMLVTRNEEDIIAGVMEEYSKDILPDFKNMMIGLEIKEAIDIGDSLDIYKMAYNNFKKK